MKRYEDLIPFLRKEYEESQVEEALTEDINLYEDKMPEPLAKAYNITWNDSKSGGNRIDPYDMMGTYGDANQKPDHRDFSVAKNNRKQSLWDYSKAYYNKLTKQEAADLLGLKVYTGKGKDKKEISINDPIPDDVKLTYDVDLAMRNTNKLRFLIKDDKHTLRRNNRNEIKGWALTEYEFRTENTNGNAVTQFFPIYRDFFETSKATNLGVSWLANRGYDRWENAKQFSGWNGVKGIYYTIKLADLIYETNEYDYPLGVPASSELLKNSEMISHMAFPGNATSVQTGIDNFLKSRFGLQVIINYLKFLKKNFDKNLDLNNFLNNEVRSKLRWKNYILEDLYYVFEYLVREGKNLNINHTSAEEIFNLIENTPNPNNKILFSQYASQNAVNLDKDFMNVLLTFLPNSDQNWFKADLEKAFTSELSNISNYNLDNIIFEIEDKVIDNTIPNEKVKQVWTKRIHNSRWHTQRASNTYPGANIQTANPNFSPYDRFKSNRKEIKVPEVADTGWNLIKGNTSNIIKYFNAEDIQNFNNYVQLLKDKLRVKQAYINALNRYNKLKKEQQYFDGDNYDYALIDAKDELQRLKAEYLGGEDAEGNKIEGILKKIQKIKDTLIFNYDKDLAKTNTFIGNTYLGIQRNYKKLLEFRNVVSDISTYTDEEIENIYGIENKQQLEELQEKIDAAISQQKECMQRIQSTKDEIAQLEEQLKQLTASLADSEKDLEANTKEISDLNDEKNNLGGSLENSILKSYEDQDKFNNFADRLDNQIETYKAKLKKQDRKKKEEPKTETDERFFKLIREFARTPKHELPEPDEDNILDDEEENTRNNASI